MQSSEQQSRPLKGSDKLKPETRNASSKRISKKTQNLASLYRTYYRMKWNSAQIFQKYRLAEGSSLHKSKLKDKISDKMSKLTLDNVLSMTEEDLKISPLSTRSNSPTASNDSSPWETIDSDADNT